MPGRGRHVGRDGGIGRADHRLRHWDVHLPGVTAVVPGLWGDVDVQRVQ